MPSGPPRCSPPPRRSRSTEVARRDDTKVIIFVTGPPQSSWFLADPNNWELPPASCANARAEKADEPAKERGIKGRYQFRQLTNSGQRYQPGNGTLALGLFSELVSGGSGDGRRLVVVAATPSRAVRERWGWRMADSSASSGQDGRPPTGPADDFGWAHTVTTGPTPGGGAGPSRASGTGQAGTGPAAPLAGGGGTVSAADAGYIVRHGPGVPVGAAAGQAVPTAEQVWQAGPPAAAPRSRRAWLVASTAVSIAALVASGVVI